MLKVQPYLYQTENLMITVIEGYAVTLECFLLIGTPNITWTWTVPATMYINNSNVNVDSSSEATSLRLQPSDVVNRGMFYCTASNAYGNYSRYINLRVKSKIELNIMRLA